MSQYFQNIISQTVEWGKCLRFYKNEGQNLISETQKYLEEASEIIITGIGASYNAGKFWEYFLWQKGYRTHLIDSSEFLDYPLLPNTIVILLSRSGKSIEIIQSLQYCKAQNIKTIGVGNDAESTLAKETDLFLPMKVNMDNSISVATYTTIFLIAHLFSKNNIKEISFDNFNDELKRFENFADENLQEFKTENPTYFLGRKPQSGTINEAVLLWHEAAKQPAFSFDTGSFRHGLQEVALNPINYFIFLNEGIQKENDLKLAKDLALLKGNVTIIGNNLPKIEGVKTFDLKTKTEIEQFLMENVLMQILSYKLTLQKNINPDEFLYCKYIVEDEGGIL